MIVAGVSAHAKKGFFAHNGGYEYTLILGIAASAWRSPARVRCHSTRCSAIGWLGTGWGLAAFVFGLAGATLQLTRRQFPAAQKVD